MVFVASSWLPQPAAVAAAAAVVAVVVVVVAAAAAAAAAVVAVAVAVEDLVVVESSEAAVVVLGQQEPALAVEIAVQLQLAAVGSAVAVAALQAGHSVYFGFAGDPSDLADLDCYPLGQLHSPAA